MQQALILAREAFASGEVPVGAIVTDSAGKIIGRGFNTRENTKNPVHHAEIIAIEEASKSVDDWRLDGCTLFVTLEPCPMCTGAIINSRISQVVFGARDSNMGACGGVIDLFSENFGHKPKVFQGILESECRVLMKSFFEEIR